MLSYNFSKFYILKKIKSVFSVIVILGLISCFLLQANQVEAKTTSTTADGNWGDVTKWSNGLPADGDVININHVMNFTNVNINIGANTTFNFNAGANGSTIQLSLGMSSSTSVLNIYSNVSFAGGINLNAGTIHVYNGATLTVTNQINQAGTLIIIDAGANFNVTGNYTNNGGNINVDGVLAISGNYDGQNSAATVTGSGDFTTTGHMNGINNSSIFGVLNPTCSGVPDGCDGRNLSGSGCGKTASVTPSTTAACSGVTVTFTSTFNTSGLNTVTYQWQSRVVGGIFTDITGATLNTYSAVPSVSTFYRMVVGSKQNSGSPFCYTYSVGVLVNVSSCNVIWLGGASGNLNNWNTGANWSTGNVPTSTDDVVILNTPNMPILTSSGTYNAKGIAVEAGATLTINAGNVLNVYGNIINNGTITMNGVSTINFLGSAAQTVSGLTTISNVTLNNPSGLSLLSPVVLSGSLFLQNGVLTTYSNLTINFDNGGNVAYNASDAGSISGNVRGRRDVPAKTHYIASPFSGSTSLQIAQTTPLYVSPYWKMYTRVFSTQNWSAVINTTTAMPLGTGFSLSFPVAAPLVLTGSYDHTYALTGTTYSNTAVGKFIFVGNPYPSTLDWDNASGWTKTNIGGAIYYWDGVNQRTSSYVAGIGTNGATQFIPAMQSFVVSTTGTGGLSSVSINNNARISLQNPSYFRVSSEDFIRVKLNTENTSQGDEAVVRFNDMATSDFDSDLDAWKIVNTGLTPSVYTTIGTEMYAVNSLADAYTQTSIPVAVKLPLDGNYVLSVENSDPTVYYVLIDKKLGTENFVSGTSYTFSGLKADDGNRFELQMRVGTTTGNNNSVSGATGLEIYSSSKGFVLQTQQYGGSDAAIEILDMTGNSIQVLNNNVLSAGATYIPMDVSSGAYLVKVTVDGNVFTGMVSLVR